MERVRFAPSPTGFLHIGGARTCLFNWLFARRMGGAFVLRIEDTDRERSKKEYEEEILASLKWLGMDWDELWYQSQRFEVYASYAQKLIDQGLAARKDGAVFFKYDFSSVSFQDAIRGEVTFNELPKEEEVIVKSDGSPTYNFCCVIDDAQMNITCVIRGEDHISNTPKQILMYKALGFSVPLFAHVPLILSPEGGRMSKRHGATAISEYRALGYLPEALGNYLMLLGWSPGNNREIISLEEAKQIFSVKDISSTGAAFDWDKLRWFNAEYVKKKSAQELAGPAVEVLRGQKFLPEDASPAYVGRVAHLLRERVHTLGELADSRYFFFDDITYEQDAQAVIEKNMSVPVTALIETLEALADFSHGSIEKEFRRICEVSGLKVRDLVHPVRVGLCGRRAGAGLFETMEVLGKERVCARLRNLLTYWHNADKQKGCV